MSTKLRTALSTFLILLAYLSNQCEGAALGSVELTIHNGDATILSSPIGHAIFEGVTMYTVRHLEEEKENPHKRPKASLFNVLLATLIVNVVTLVALLSLIPVLMSTKWSCFQSTFWVANAHLHVPAEIARQCMNEEKSSLTNKVDTHTKDQRTALFVDIVVPSYACGAILATTVFLVIPEAILFIQRGISSEEGEIEILTGTIVRFGAALMTGYMLPLILGALLPRSSERIGATECVYESDLEAMNAQKKNVHKKTVEEEEKDDEEKMMDMSLSNESFEDHSDANGDETSLVESKASNTVSESSTDGDMNVKNKTSEYYNIKYRLITSIFFSDAIHNFIDGIFIGAAFLTCSNATAVCVTILTIYSEISQEMADYFLLTQCAGMSIPRACLLLFSSGLAVVVGALMIIGAGLGELGIGVFLAFASGVYLHISASECLPRVYSVVKASRDRWFALTFFVLGALPIGLTLLDHGHCDE